MKKNLTRISLALKEGEETIKCVDLNMINILTGPNGSGKTMILTSSFFISEIANLVCMNLKEDVLNEMSSFISKSTFKRNLSGFVSGDFEGSLITVYIENDIVTSIKTENWEATEVPYVTYMSSQMRTFDAISSYLLIRKMLSSLSEENKLKALCENYKYYDVKYIEKSIQKMPLMINPILKSFLANYISDDVEMIDVDLESCDFFYKIKNSDKKYYMRSKGAGEQSIFNILIGNSN